MGKNILSYPFKVDRDFPLTGTSEGSLRALALPREESFKRKLNGEVNVAGFGK